MTALTEMDGKARGNRPRLPSLFRPATERQRGRPSFPILPRVEHEGEAEKGRNGGRQTLHPKPPWNTGLFFLSPPIREIRLTRSELGTERPSHASHPMTVALQVTQHGGPLQPVQVFVGEQPCAGRRVVVNWFLPTLLTPLASTSVTRTSCVRPFAAGISEGTRARAGKVIVGLPWLVVRLLSGPPHPLELSPRYSIGHSAFSLNFLDFRYPGAPAPPRPRWASVLSDAFHTLSSSRGVKFEAAPVRPSGPSAAIGPIEHYAISRSGGADDRLGMARGRFLLRNPASRAFRPDPARATRATASRPSPSPPLCAWPLPLPAGTLAEMCALPISLPAGSAPILRAHPHRMEADREVIDRSNVKRRATHGSSLPPEQRKAIILGPWVEAVEPL